MKLQYDLHNPHDKRAVKYGTVVMDDGELIDLIEDSYINQGGTPTACWYEASAESRTIKDEAGNAAKYKVRWEITNADAEYAEDACDWDVFTIKMVDE